MKFPDVSITPPVLTNWQYSFRSLLLGSGQIWAIQEADGLDLPKVRNQDPDRPLDSGQFEGLDYMSGRDITLKLHSQFASNAAMRSALTALETVMNPPEDAVTEYPIWFQRPGNPLLCCQVRPRQFRLTSDRKTSSPKIYQPLCQLHATSAYVYGPTQSQTIQVPGVSAGFAFNLAFNLSFGGGGSVGVLTINNTGVVSARPVFFFTGPMIVPTITNGSLTNNPFISVNMTLAAGDLLVVDTDLDGPSIVYYAAGSSSGSSRLINLVSGSTPFKLQVGTNKLVLTSQDSAPTGGTCEVMWAPTYPIAL